MIQLRASGKLSRALYSAQLPSWFAMFTLLVYVSTWFMVDLVPKGSVWRADAYGRLFSMAFGPQDAFDASIRASGIAMACFSMVSLATGYGLSKLTHVEAHVYAASHVVFGVLLVSLASIDVAATAILAVALGACACACARSCACMCGRSLSP